MHFDQEWLDEKALELAESITTCMAVDTEGNSYPGELGKEIDDNHKVRITGYWHCEDIPSGAGVIRMEMYDQNGKRAIYDEQDEAVYLVDDEGIYCQARLSIAAVDITEETDGD